MAVTYTFATQTGPIPLSQLDANFAYYDAAYNITGSAISFTGAVTLSTGTANGVAYLNGSKVLTTGSALTFDGSLLNTTGSVRAQTSLFVYGSGDRLNVFPQAAGSGVQLLSTNNANSAYAPLTLDGSATIFNASGGEQMRLTSTGLGIGTSSPSYKLDVNGVTRLGAGTPAILAGVGGAFAGGQGELYTISTNNMGIGTTGAAALRLYTNSTLQATLDSSGNLGLGVTPSAWGSSYKSIEVSNGGGNIFGIVGNGTTGIGFNFYNNNTNDIYKFSTYAAKFQVNNAGQFAWYTAPSGTAGNAISFTQAMTLDASGNLALGTITADGMLTVSAPANTGYGSFNAATSSYASLSFKNAGTAYAYMGSANAFVSGGTASDFALRSQNALTFATGGGTERARINSSGAWSFGSSGTATGTSGQVLTSAGSAAAPTWTTLPALAKSTSVFTTGAAQTYTAPANTTWVKVTVVGPGGNGGGAASQRATGGGGGGVAIKWLSMTAAQTLTYTVGTAAGTASSVSSGTLTITTITANSGANGAGTAYALSQTAGGTGGAATGGDLNITGGAGGYSFGSSTTVSTNFSGKGGDCPGFGTGGPAQAMIVTAGVAGNGYGAGGGGAHGSATTAAGTGGVIIFEAY